jgi:hypothetical protein
MERVMRMKKVLIVILALILTLSGLFFWKGGHHAIFLSEIMEEWLDEDTADQSLTLMLMKPDITVDDRGQAKPVVRQMSLNADTFWTEYADRTLFGLSAQGMTAWTDGKNLYMDTGKAYALPELTQFRKDLRELAVGMLLHGRVTKQNDTYSLTMKTEELELDVDIIADNRVQAVNLTAVLPDDTAVQLSITAKDPVSHPVPQPVADAMVHAKMEPPTDIREPLELLIPALEELLPLEGDLTLGVESGILKLEETVKLRLSSERAELERKGVIVSLGFPVEPAALEPLGAALLLLRNGDFLISGRDTEIKVTLPPETTGQLCAALVPELGNLGMTFGESKAVVSIQDGVLSTVTLTAAGEVPFLVTTIPLSFHAELNIP